MSIRGILFQAEMVRAILNTQPDVWPPKPINPEMPFKWQTRRVIRPQPLTGQISMFESYENIAWKEKIYPNANEMAQKSCPYGPVGREVYGKETWSIFESTYSYETGWEGEGTIVPKDYKVKPVGGEWLKYSTIYKATGEGIIDTDCGDRWISSIFMPRWASRLYLETVMVGAGRVSQLSTIDAIAEGILAPAKAKRMRGRNLSRNTIGAYGVLWDRINGGPRPVYRKGKLVRYESYPWAGRGKLELYKGQTNFITPDPFVWIVHFKRKSQFKTVVVPTEIKPISKQLELV